MPVGRPTRLNKIKMVQIFYALYANIFSLMASEGVPEAVSFQIFPFEVDPFTAPTIQLQGFDTF